MAEMEAAFQSAAQLWELPASEPGADAVSRDWLATTCSWETEGRPLHQHALEWLALKRAIGLWQQLADEQPDNLEFQKKLSIHYWEILREFPIKIERVSWQEPLEQERVA